MVLSVDVLLQSAGAMDSNSRSDMFAECMAYGINDTLCYHHAEDKALATKQLECWGKWLNWAFKRFSVRWDIIHELAPVSQRPDVAFAITRYLNRCDNTTLLTLTLATQLLSSFILAVACLESACDAQEAMEASWLEYHHQMQQWGEDAELLAKKQAQLEDLQHTLAFYQQYADGDQSATMSI